jgi:hypothetical protein
MKQRSGTHIEDRSARLTILIDPRKKAMFEQLCAAEDVTPSQLVRRLIRGYIEQRLGRPWTPALRADSPGKPKRAPGAPATAAQRRGRPQRRVA